MVNIFQQSLIDTFNEIGQLLREELARELIEQGHKATGDLANSIEQKVSIFIDMLELQVSYLDYARYLENGIPASAYKKEPGKLEIDALVRWIKIKGLSRGMDRKDTSFAWAIAQNHRKYGFPSRQADAFSKNGRYIGFQTHVLDANVDRIAGMLFASIDGDIDLAFNSIINKIQSA